MSVKLKSCLEGLEKWFGQRNVRINMDEEYAGHPTLKEEMKEIKVQKEEMQSSLRQTLKGIELYEKMNGGTGFNYWRKGIY